MSYCRNQNHPYDCQCECDSPQIGNIKSPVIKGALAIDLIITGAISAYRSAGKAYVGTRELTKSFIRWLDKKGYLD